MDYYELFAAVFSANLMALLFFWGLKNANKPPVEVGWWAYAALAFPLALFILALIARS